MTRAFVAKGHGYTNPSPGSSYEPCTAFASYHVIAAPLPGNSAAERDARVFGRINDKKGTGVCYGAYIIALAVDERAWRDDIETTLARNPDLYILMQNGCGREVLMVPSFYDRGDLSRALVALPERLQYAMLHTIWSIASNAREEAKHQTARLWGEAYLDGRIRKKTKRGRTTVSVETPFERDLRLGRTRPNSIAIDTATGEITPA